jgi:membrane peptidoglycan carboxypeptidase
VFPASGPFNEVRGYAGLPGFAQRLTEGGFHIVAQARLSPALAWLTGWRITPPFREPAAVGLIVRGENGTILYDATVRQRVFDRYEDIPPLVVKSLLLVENRELDEPDAPTRNPVVDWGRLGKAGLTYAGHKIGLPVRVEGGSTLATQIEKFRYADGGRTNSAADKLRQMIGASLRVYRSGPDTRIQRHEIVLDYLNSVPLAAAPDYGEVYGLGNGLYAWFGIELKQVQSLAAESSENRDRQRIFKHVLALICAARAPSYYLLQDRPALEARTNFYVRQLEAGGTISKDFARGVESFTLDFLPRAPAPAPVAYVQRKATNAFRNHLMAALGVPDLYTLDRLHLDAETTLNVHLQNEVLRLFQNLKDPQFVEANGLRQEHLLSQGDPRYVTYSFTLFERTPAGNVLRVQADTLNQPFDLNEGMKLELGSTAKVRTLAHYLELVASLHQEFHGLDASALKKKSQSAADPITRWTAETMSADPSINLESLLDKALDRKYSGNPGEVFFTGGGAHVFANFDSDENGEMYTLRDGLYHSVNLVYIRLMRDLVRFHQARLPYNADIVLNQPDDPIRLKMLHEIAEKESRQVLFESYQSYRHLDCGEDSGIQEHLAAPPRNAVFCLASGQ